MINQLSTKVDQNNAAQGSQFKKNTRQLLITEENATAKSHTNSMGRNRHNSQHEVPLQKSRLENAAR